MLPLQNIRLVRGLVGQAEPGRSGGAQFNKSSAEIGRMLGMTWQSAWARFRDETEPLDVAR